MLESLWSFTDCRTPMLMLGGKAQHNVTVQPPYSFKAKVNVAGPEGGGGDGRHREWKSEVGGLRGVGGKDENREGYSAPVHTQRSPFPG